MSQIGKQQEQERDARIATLRAELEALLAEGGRLCQGAEHLLLGECCFRGIFESSPDCMFVKDLEGRYVVVNPALARLFGRSAEEIIGLFDRDLFEAADARRVEEADRQVLAGQTVITEDPLRVEAQQYTFHVIKAPLRGRDGGIIGLYGIARDITDRRWAEHALSLSEERYRHLIRHMPIGAAVYEADGDGEDFIIKEMNDAGMRLCLVTPEQCLGRRMTEVFPGTRGSDFLRIYQRVWRTGTPESLPPTYYAFGDLAGWFELHAFRLPSGDLVSIFQDVSERIEGEESLRRVQSQVRALAANLPGIMHSYVRRADGRRDLLFLSQGLEELVGAEVAAWLGRSIERYLLLIHPDDWEPYQRALQHAMSVATHFEFEYRIWTDRGYRWIHSLAQREAERDGESIWHGLLLDIHERRLAEAALRQSEEKLSHLFLSSPDSISVVREADDLILDVNPGFTRLTGYTRKDVVGTAARSLDGWVDPEDRRRILDELNRRGRVEGFVTKARRRDGSYFVGDVSLGRVQIDGERCLMFVTRDITPRIEAQEEVRRRAEMEAMLRRELSHRVQNNLMSLLGLVDMAATSAETPQACAEAIRSRVHAMATVHSLLTRAEGASLELRELISTLTPPGGRGAVHIEGESLQLGSDIGQKLGLVLNELMANSWKYGSLSAPRGVVEVGWSVEVTPGGERRLVLLWSERDGPPIETEPTPGAGLGLIIGLVRSDLGGSAELSFPRGGARHIIRAQLSTAG